jgi:hypothetical protein
MKLRLVAPALLDISIINSIADSMVIVVKEVISGEGENYYRTRGEEVSIRGFALRTTDRLTVIP